MCAHLAARFAIPAYKKAPALQQRAFAHNTGNYSYGNTAQFPPNGLSTAPAAAALRIMRYCPILFCFPLREDDFVDKEEDQHQNVTVEHRGSDVIDKVRHQQARNRRSHAVDEVNKAGDQTECQHQAICLARSTLPRNTKLRWIRYRIFIQSRENGRVRAQNGSCNLACLDHASNVHQHP